jgi:hypothetical protein
VQKALVRRCQAVLGAGLQVLEGHIVRGLLSGQWAGVRELDINEIDLHLARSLDTNDKGRTLAGGDDLVGVVDRLQQETESTLQLCDDRLCERSEVDRGVLVVDVLGELGDTLGVRLALENLALALEQGLQLLVVGNDTIVDDREPGSWVAPISW